MVTAALILILCGSGSCGLALLFYWLLRSKRRRHQRLRTTGVTVDGVVVERPTIDIDSEGRGSLPLLVAAFLDESGRQHQVRSEGGSSRFPAVGSKVVVLYDRSDPTDAMIQADMDNADMLGPLFIYVFGGLGILCWLVALLLWGIHALLA
jgi:hypothetical protein